MLHRFVSATALASIAIALAASVVVLMHAATTHKLYSLTVLWCFAPLVWGVWAMVAPAGWVPQRMPNWGAILGMILGLLGVFVLNLPLRTLGLMLSLRVRLAAVLVVVLFYYILWALVRTVYKTLTFAPAAARAKVAGAGKKGPRWPSAATRSARWRDWLVDRCGGHEHVPQWLRQDDSGQCPMVFLLWTACRRRASTTATRKATACAQNCRSVLSFSK